MKKNKVLNIIRLFFAANLLNILLLAHSYAEEKDYPLVDVRVSEWFSRGDASWQSSFITPSDYRVISELKYESINSDILLLEAKIRPTSHFSLNINWGAGSIDKGSGTDIDAYGLSFQPDPELLVFSESQFDLDGDVRLWGVDLCAHFPSREIVFLERLAVFIGYHHYEDNLRMFNGRQTWPSTGPFDGLNSTYDFEWDYFQVGAQTDFSLVSEPKPYLHSLDFDISLGVIPYTMYKGTAVWNLRSDRKQDPSFKHKNDGGVGVDISMSFNYNPFKFMGCALGYRYFYIRTEDGEETIYFADGSEYTKTLDEAKAVRHGPFVSLYFLF